MNSLSRVRLLATPWTAAYQAPLSMGFSRQECWSGSPLPSPIAILHIYSFFAGCTYSCPQSFAFIETAFFFFFFCLLITLLGITLVFFFARLSSFIKRVFVSILGDIFVVSSYHIMKDLALLLVLDILLYVY